MIDAAVAEGATAATGGAAACRRRGLRGRHVRRARRSSPASSPSHTVAREEVFGPVLSVLEVDDLDEAVAVVNSVEYGLSAAVYTRDINAALRAVARHRHRHHLRQRPHHRRGDPAAVRRHQAHRQRLPRGGRPRHRAVQPGQDRLRRLLGPPPAGPDRQPGGRVDDARVRHRHAAPPAAWLARYDDAVAPVLPRLLRRRRRAGRGLVGVGRRRPPLPRPRLGHRRHQHRAPAPARRRGDPRARSTRLLHTSVVLKHQPYIEAAEAIAGAGAVPRPTRKVFLCNSGAEAVDGAIKLARRTTRQARASSPSGGRSTAARMGATTPHHGQGGLPGGLRAAAARRPHRALLHPGDRRRRRRGRRGARPAARHRGAAGDASRR